MKASLVWFDNTCIRHCWNNFPVFVRTKELYGSQRNTALTLRSKRYRLSGAKMWREAGRGSVYCVVGGLEEEGEQRHWRQRCITTVERYERHKTHPRITFVSNPTGEPIFCDNHCPISPLVSDCSSMCSNTDQRNKVSSNWPPSISAPRYTKAKACSRLTWPVLVKFNAASDRRRVVGVSVYCCGVPRCGVYL